MTIQIILKSGREKSVKNRHPWVFSGAIQRVVGQPANGDTVDVVDNRQNFLARGIYNEQSQIQVRLFTWQPDEMIDPHFWRQRLQRAIAGRQALWQSDTTAYRLVHSEADGLSGLIVDRYGSWLVVQFLSLAVERHRQAIITALAELLEPHGIYERSDVETRKKEGLPLKNGLIMGEMPPDWIEISENKHLFLVDVKGGHKTGFYLDQRENRQKSTLYFSVAEVLNVFAYTGAFAVYAAKAGAERVVQVDSSAQVLETAKQTMQLNGLVGRDDSYIVADAFELLRTYYRQGQQFEVVILDPPKFVQHKGQLEKATRGYKDINMLGMKLLRPGGVLISFSCSGLVSADLFQKVLFGAAVDAGREVQIIEQFSQSSDHPILLTCPESAYLKGLVCRVW